MWKHVFIFLNDNQRKHTDAFVCSNCARQQKGINRESLNNKLNAVVIVVRTHYAFVPLCFCRRHRNRLKSFLKYASKWKFLSFINIAETWLMAEYTLINCIHCTVWTRNSYPHLLVYVIRVLRCVAKSSCGRTPYVPWLQKKLSAVMSKCLKN